MLFFVLPIFRLTAKIRDFCLEKNAEQVTPEDNKIYLPHQTLMCWCKCTVYMAILNNPPLCTFPPVPFTPHHVKKPATTKTNPLVGGNKSKPTQKQAENCNSYAIFRK